MQSRGVKKLEKQCCGCAVCAQVCSKQAISMKTNAEGFQYAVIDEEKCVNCGACSKVCPIHEEKTQRPEVDSTAIKCYAARANNDDIMDSRSGGAFYGMANAIVSQGGVVYGAVLDADCKSVYHCQANSEKEIAPMRNSKYCQSSTEHIWKDVILALRSGHDVLFSGTPCQVAGLKSLLNQMKIDAHSLFTCDFVCHGVPSPLVWRNNVEYIEKRNKGVVEAANFRDKLLGWKSHIESYRVNGKMRYDNWYTQMYYAGYISRPSCSVCPFSHVTRPADITLSDGWNLIGQIPEWNDNRGVSGLIIQTEKGSELLHRTGDRLLIKPVELRFEKQPHLLKAPAMNDKRDEFWSLYREKGMEAARKKYANSLIEKIKIPYNLLKSRERSTKK